MEQFAITLATSSAIKASAKDGNFVTNFFQFWVQDFGLSLGFYYVGAVLPGALEGATDYVMPTIAGIGNGVPGVGFASIIADMSRLIRADLENSTPKT